jgi:hypothetical protein
VTEPPAAAAHRRPSRRGRYAPPPPAEAGSGSAFPRRDYSDVQPRPLREAYEW